MDSRAIQDDTGATGGVTHPPRRHDGVIVMATSVGGLKALKAVIGMLPAGLDSAVVILQHIAQGAPILLPEILRPAAVLPIVTAVDGLRLRNGHVYVVPPGKHTVIRAGPVFRSELSPPTHFVRPSADKLFSSAAEVYGARTIGVILTGRGDDGMEGAHAIKDTGGTVICQDRESSLAFGMPGAAIVHGDADYVVALDDIAPLLTRLVSEAAL